MGKHGDKQTDNLQFRFRSNKTQTNKKTSRFVYSNSNIKVSILSRDFTVQY